MRCDVLLLNCFIVFGSYCLSHVQAAWLVDHVKQHHAKRLSNVFQTYQGMSKIRCAQSCQSRINSHSCSGANYNKQTKECSLSNDSFQNLTDAEDIVALLLPSDTCFQPGYLISGPNGIPDESFSVSSVLLNGANSFTPNWSRLDTVEGSIGTGSWSAGTADTNQWIQARFQIPKTVEGIAIQGRPLNSGQYVTEFKLNCSLDCITFLEVSNSDGVAMKFVGNSDKNSTATRMLPTPVTALCVKLNPTMWSSYISLRWDIIGC